MNIKAILIIYNRSSFYIIHLTASITSYHINCSCFWQKNLQQELRAVHSHLDSHQHEVEELKQQLLKKADLEEEVWVVTNRLESERRIWAKEEEERRIEIAALMAQQNRTLLRQQEKAKEKHYMVRERRIYFD